MVQIESLSFCYQPVSPIFLDFDWNIARGERWAIVGPTGCGKTTLLYLMAGLYLPSSGKISINGEVLRKPRASTGLILQEYGLLPWKTVFQNVALGLMVRRIESRKVNKTTLRWISLLGIDSVADRYPAELSGGQRQRAAIARTLALDPDLLLMDEPFGSLDALTREELQNMTLDLWQSLSSTIVLVTHNIEEAVLLCEKIMLLRRPPNINPVTVENPGSGFPEYRNNPGFVSKCQQIRKMIEHIKEDEDRPVTMRQ